MQRISSNLTLFFKIFFPTFWFIFMGCLTLFVLFADSETTPLFPDLQGKLIFLFLFLACALVIYLLLMRLLRMEAGNDGFYVSNYFKTYRYQFKDIKEVRYYKFLGFNTMRIEMKDKTSMGKTLRILYKKLYWEDFLSGHPEIAKLIK